MTEIGVTAGARGARADGPPGARAGGVRSVLHAYSSTILK